MKIKRWNWQRCALKYVWLTALSFDCTLNVAAQVSPGEILDRQLKDLEKQYFPQLKKLNQDIARAHYPFPFYLSRVVGLDPAQQAEADTRGLEFVRFKGRVVLKATGNYNAAYDSKQLTRNERAARTFRDVIFPVLQLMTQQIPPDVECDAFGFEVAYHVRDITKSYTYEGQDTLTVVLDRKDAFQMILEKDDNGRQEILDRSLVYLGGQEYGMSLIDRDPTVIGGAAKSKPEEATSTAFSSTSTDRLIRSNSKLLPAIAREGGESSPGISTKVDLSKAKPAPTAADVEKLQAQYQPLLESISKGGAAKFGFVDYDPPAFVIISKQLVLQMTLKNTTGYDPEKESLYKRAALTFDLFLAPKMKDLLNAIPSDLPADYYDFTVLNSLRPNSVGKERSEAVEFLLPKDLAQKFANSEITNQELIDKGQVIVNGVRIALNLQLVE